MEDLKNRACNFLSENYFYHRYLQKLTPSVHQTPMPHHSVLLTADKVTHVRKFCHLGFAISFRRRNTSWGTVMQTNRFSSVQL